MRTESEFSFEEYVDGSGSRNPKPETSISSKNKLNSYGFIFNFVSKSTPMYKYNDQLTSERIITSYLTLDNIPIWERRSG